MEADTHRLGLPGIAPANQLVVGGSRAPPGVSGLNLEPSLDVLEDGIHAPETATCQHSSLCRESGRNLVDNWLFSPLTAPIDRKTVNAENNRAVASPNQIFPRII